LPEVARSPVIAFARMTRVLVVCEENPCRPPTLQLLLE